MSTMTPKEGITTSDAKKEHAVRLGGHLPLPPVNVSRETTAPASTTASIQTAVNDMEARILEQVSLLTIASPKEEEDAREVSFSADDFPDGLSTAATTTTCVAPSSHGTTLTPSPIRPRSKRTCSSLTSPVMDSSPSRASAFGPRRKRRRAGTLATAPRLPFDNDSQTPVTPANISLFSIYDERLERLASRLEETNTQTITSPPSPIQLRDDTVLPPVVSWMKPRRYRRDGRRLRPRPSQRAAVFPFLTPRELTPLESLELEMEASPIVMPALH